jgi:uncharacterized repeat protein (TIGR02543 family)
MKRNILRKALSLLLALVLLVPLASPAFAAEDTEESTLQSDAPMILGAGNGLAVWAGEKLAGGVVSSIAGYPMNQAMGKIFGTQTDQVLQALEAIKAQIQGLKNDIAEMSKKLDRQELRNFLNGYGDFINNYISVYNELSSAQKITDPAMLKILFEKIFEGEDPHYMVGGDPLKNATINLGNQLRNVKAVEGGSCNIFGAIDLYDRYVNIWEHQGYVMREDFRNKQLSIYTLFSAMSQLACQSIIDNNQGDTPSAKLAKYQAESRMKDLKDDAELMDKMVKRTSVVNPDNTISVYRHPNLRIARDIKQGIDLCAFSPDIKVAYVTKNAWGDEAAWADFSQSAERYTSVDYLMSLTNDKTAQRTAWSGGWEVYTNQPTPAEYQILRENYGGQQSLYNIFFDEDKGNFNNVGNRPAELAFLCNHYVSRNCRDGWINWESNNHVGNNGEVYGWWKFSAARFISNTYAGSARDNWFDPSNAFIVNKYLGEVKQGSLQGPNSPPDIEYKATISGMDTEYEVGYDSGITLEIDKTGDAYQWAVNKNDDKGFVELEGETGKTYSISDGLTSDMNGWQYSCTVIDNPAEPDGEPTYTHALPVTLNLTGDGISDPVTEHEVGDADALKTALDKVDSGEWNQHTLKLADDITYPNPIAPDGMCNVTLDLNGYTLTLQPGANAESNVNAMSNNPQIAAICLDQDQLTIEDSSIDGLGVLNIVAGPGIEYGIYAANDSGFDGYDAVTEEAVTVTSTVGGTAIYAADNSFVGVKGSVRAEGEDAYGIECLNSGSAVIVDKDVTVSGKSACGAYVASFDGGTSTQVVRIFGDITVSGENSRAALLDAEAELTVRGSVTVTGGREGISVSNGYVETWGNVTAPDYAINARSNKASVVVLGNISVTRENAVAVSSVGAEIRVGGNVSSSNSGGVGILAATWMDPDDGDVKCGASVTAEGKIVAVTPLLIESTPVTDESEKASTDLDYNVFTIPGKGTSAVKAMPGAFEVKTTSLVTFDKNGGDTEASPNTKAVITGGKAGILPTAPGRSGYTFNGWNTQASGSGTAFTADTDVTGPITVYAQWEYSVVNAAISPASASYDLNSPGDVSTAIIWNSASTVTDVVYGTTSLTTPAAYIVTESALTIKSSYLEEQGFSEGNTAEFTIDFDKGDSAKLTVNIVKNYIPSDDAGLSDLKVGGSTVSGFDPNVFAYSVELPYDTLPGSQAATVSADVYNTKAVASITQAISLPGSAAVKVTAEDKTTTKTYTVNFTLEQAPTTYTITVQTDGNGTANANISSASQGTQITLTANANNGYRFKEWQVIDGGVTITGNKFNMPASNVTVKVIFEYKSGGGSGGGGSSIPTTPTIPAAGGTVSVNYTASNGTASLSLPMVKVNEIIEKSKSNEAVLDLSKVSGITAASIPKDVLATFAKAGLDTTVKLPVGTITLDEDATVSVAQQASGSNLAIELKQAATSSLTDEQKKSVKSGDIVLDINITSGTKKISTFDGTLAVSMPYTGPQPVAVWYLNDGGELEKLDCTFKNGVVSFNLDHLSLYVVGQDTAKPTWVNPFTDAKEADWFYAAVSFCAEKGITNGTSATTFSPNATLTREQFITMLLRAYGIEPIVNPSDNFSDAGSTYYTGYLAAAKDRGISNGVGDNKFAPGKAITRQEMFTLLYNVIKFLNKLPTTDNGKTLADFTDSGDVATWARDAMIMLIKSGTVSGSGGKLDPIGGSTRAQMAQVLYNLLGK